MSREKITPYKEVKEEFGRNIDVKITFARHSQKSSSKVFETENLKEISQASISPSGKERAKKLGEKMRGRKFVKGYATTIERTKETLKEIFSGAENPEVLIKEYLSFPALVMAEETAQKYSSILEETKKEIMKKFAPQNFEDLSLDDQEKIVEQAEEPAIEWYLAHDKTRPDPETYSPYEQASLAAYKINHFINLPERLKNNKAIDLITVGHKSSTESFLKYVLIRETAGQKVTGLNKLEEIGGSLKILDSWDLDIKTDESGEKNVKISLYRENDPQPQEYGVDLKALQELAEVGRKLLSQEKKLIDQPK